jgi:hypothetical protein
MGARSIFKYISPAPASATDTLLFAVALMPMIVNAVVVKQYLRK